MVNSTHTQKVFGDIDFFLMLFFEEIFVCVKNLPVLFISLLLMVVFVCNKKEIFKNN